MAYHKLAQHIHHFNLMGNCSSTVAPEGLEGQQSGKKNWCTCCGAGHDPTKALLGRAGKDGEPERPTLEEAKTWAQNFERLLQNRFGVQMFQDFLRSQYGEENLNFWLAVEEYKNAEGENKMDMARMIYEDYVSTLSPTEISLDAKVRAEVDKNMVDPHNSTFDAAQHHIYALMYQDCYPRFAKSKQYKQLLKNLRA